MSEIKLTIDEVIEHCEKTVSKTERILGLNKVDPRLSKTYLEHKQVAEWLKELKHLRGAMKRILTRLEKLPYADDEGFVWLEDAKDVVKEEGGIE